jgi:hypothetical protein
VAHGVAQPGEVARRVVAQSMARLDLDPHDPAIGGFEHEVDLGPIVFAVVVQRRGDRGPGELLAKFERDEGLDERPSCLDGRGPPLLRHVEQGGRQTGVAHEEFGAAGQAFPGVRAPRGDLFDEEERPQRGQVPVQRGRGQTGRARELGDVDGPRRARGEQADQAREVAQPLDLRDVVHVALQRRGQVRVEPGPSASRGRACHGGRETAAEHAFG